MNHYIDMWQRIFQFEGRTSRPGYWWPMLINGIVGALVSLIFSDLIVSIYNIALIAAAFADRCILVTGPGPGAIRDAARSGDVLELMGKGNIRLVVNRINRKLVRAMDLTIDDLMDTAGLPLLGVVPEDPNVTLAAAFKKDILSYRRKSAAAACCRIARRMQGYFTPIFL